MLSCQAPCSSESVGTTSHLFLNLVQTIAAAQCLISPKEMWPRDYGKKAKRKGLGEYDFVVVGAGSAGAIVASRLSEIPHWKILLLEAGGDPPMESVVPLLRAQMPFTPVDWAFRDKARRACRINGKYGCPVARGKMLGGTSSLNWMLYMRGFPYDYNQWANYGVTGWSYEDVLPYFKKSEGNTNPAHVAEDGGKYHSADGPVKVETPPINPIDAPLIEAFKEAGVEFVEDINANKYTGFYQYQLTSYGGIRYSTAQAFLLRSIKRKNLHVIKHAYVNRILLDKDNRAYGVEFTYKGKCKLKAKATKEVIVSAGTMQSPTLLMRSGIGPEEELKKHGIRCKADLAVGHNYHDHSSVALVFKSQLVPLPLPSTYAADQWYQYLLNRGGAFNVSFLFGGRVDTTNSGGLPDIQFDMGSQPINSPSLWITGVNRFADYTSQNCPLLKENKQSVLTYVLVNGITAKSTGAVTLNSTTLEAYLNSGYFRDPSDMDTLLRGIRTMQGIMNSPSVQKYGVEIIKPELPECDEFIFDSVEYWRCYITYLSTTGTHQVGTGKTGTDSTSVVDSECRVYKTTGLRQIDCGISPVILSANTNAAAMMIGEKGADLIKQTYLSCCGS